MNRGPKYDTDYEIVRIEKYIDEQGNIKRAVCYATNAEGLKCWFRYEDMILSHPYWYIPNPSLFYNGKKWKPELKLWMKGKKGNKGTSSTYPRDQSRDIQGAQQGGPRYEGPSSTSTRDQSRDIQGVQQDGTRHDGEYYYRDSQGAT